MWKRPVIAVRERTGFGSNATFSTISRSGRSTLVTGIETRPFDSLTAPDGRDCVFFAATAPVTDEFAVDAPSLLRAVTTTRSRLPTSAATTVYCCLVAPEMSTQAAPLALQRCH